MTEQRTEDDELADLSGRLMSLSADLDHDPDPVGRLREIEWLAGASADRFQKRPCHERAEAVIRRNAGGQPQRRPGCLSYAVSFLFGLLIVPAAIVLIAVIVSFV